jgi:hypothetical protein
MKAKPEDVNMQPVGFRITRILTDHICPKTSWALLCAHAKTVEIEFFIMDLLQSQEDCTTRTTLPANNMHYGT